MVLTQSLEAPRSSPTLSLRLSMIACLPAFFYDYSMILAANQQAENVEWLLLNGRSKIRLKWIIKKISTEASRMDDEAKLRLTETVHGAG
jgi:hypothetical protein